LKNSPTDSSGFELGISVVILKPGFKASLPTPFAPETTEVQQNGRVL
jgi:hypothetical protein